MKITKNLRRQIKIARKHGYDSVISVKARNWYTNAVDLITFDIIDNMENGQSTSGVRGEWQTKEWLKDHESFNYVDFATLMKLEDIIKETFIYTATIKNGTVEYMVFRVKNNTPVLIGGGGAHPEYYKGHNAEVQEILKAIGAIKTTNEYYAENKNFQIIGL